MYAEIVLIVLPKSIAMLSIHLMIKMLPSSDERC